MGRRAIVCATVTGVAGLALLITGAVLIPVLNNITVEKVDEVRQSVFKDMCTETAVGSFTL